MTDDHKRIVIAEDEENDVMLIKIVLEEFGLENDCAVVHDGREALEYLDSRAAAQETPELMLLDLKLPKLNGFEVMEHIRNTAQLADIAVVIFSSSLDEDDRTKALSSGAADFMVKPMEFEDFRKTISKVVTTYLNPPPSPIQRS